jgi:DNA-binding transcriptional LysR family regulator
MLMFDLSSGDLRALRSVAQRGSFTAAAAELGYTQSAISKRIASLERAVGRPLVIRERRGIRLTEAGEVLLRHGNAALDALEDADRELNDDETPRMRPVRLGAFASAAASVVPLALERLGNERRGVSVTLREGTSAALVAGVSAPAPPDHRGAPLEIETLAEGPLRIAVSTRHPLAGRSHINVEELEGERWVVARSEENEWLLGIWPGMSNRADAPYVVRDWLTKLRLVASAAAITTIPDVLARALPPDVRAVTVNDTSVEHRRLLLARIPGPVTPESHAVAEALRAAALALMSPTQVTQ